jgi:hypothetical protein
VPSKRIDHALHKPALKFWAASAKPDIPTEAKIRDRVCGAISDLLANPTHRENPAAGKLNGVYDLISRRL